MANSKKIKLSQDCNGTMSKEVQKFVEYIRLKTVHPNPDYGSCRLWLLEYLKGIGLEIVLDKELVPDNPILIAKYIGSDPEEQGILLNTHTDVVPCDYEKWICDPFEGCVSNDGKVYGRGTQDMKCVTIQYLEVLRRMKMNNVKVKRNIYISFLPDEEMGGFKGMIVLCKSPEFEALNIGLALDEGLAREDDDMTVYYGERHVIWIEVTLNGNPGHGSRFIQDTAAEKLRKFINRSLDFRNKEEKKLSGNQCKPAGDVATVNITMLSGGVQPNVVPSEFKITLDCRASHAETFADFKKRLESWVEEAGGGEIKYLREAEHKNNSSISPDNKWWSALTSACESHNICLKPEIFPAGTDSRYLREIGIPAYGFSPINNTPILLHDHNEWLGVDTFMRGIDILESVVLNMANV